MRLSQSSNGHLWYIIDDEDKIRFVSISQSICSGKLKKITSDKRYSKDKK